MSRFIIITSIFPPSEAIKLYSKFNDYQLVVVGDKKTPANWKCENVIYLSPEDQENLNFKIVKLLPWNHYCRKMIGYLYAMKNGAETIIDTDDDNKPLDTWHELPFAGEFLQTAGDNGFVNIYKHFSDEFVWPRGFPLREILEPKEIGNLIKKPGKVGIWQFLANGDPDVDAVYRLVVNKLITFKDKDPFVLGRGTVSPFNSQNTFFSKDAFPLLYLPSFVTFRFTDILRGLVAQPLLWEADMRLGIGPATVKQDRNPHDYMKDFESEIPVFINTEKSVELAVGAARGKSMESGLISAYESLRSAHIVGDDEVELAKAWIDDITALR